MLFTITNYGLGTCIQGRADSLPPKERRPREPRSEGELDAEGLRK